MLGVPLTFDNIHIQQNMENQSTNGQHQALIMDAAQYAVRVNEEPEYAQQQAYDYEGQPMNQKESGRMHQS